MSKPFEYQIPRAAKYDLIEIKAKSQTRWSVSQANKYLNELRQVFRLLASSPKIGRSRPELGEGIYSFPHSSHVVYFKLEAKQVIIARVFHKRQLPQKHLANN